MYLPSLFEETRTEILHQMMRSHPLACLVTHNTGQLEANHMPFLLDADAGPLGTLRGHVARANPVWRELPGESEALIIFQGPQSYISPSWYPSKHEHGKVVPTWNYAVVHAYGFPQVIDDSAWLLNNVSQLTDGQESSQAQPWKVSDAPAEFVANLLRSIVGIQITITRLRGKWKVSQNRPHTDRLGVVAGLESVASDAAREMAALVRERSE